MTPVSYQMVTDKISVEYGIRHPDCFIQVEVPEEHLKFWRNIDNKDLYMKMIRIVRDDIPESLRIDYGAPIGNDTDPSKNFNKVTIRIHNMATLPFYEHVLKKVATNLASKLY